LGFGEALAKAQVQSNPVTEPKRSQNPKRPLSLFPTAKRLQYFLNRSSTSPSFILDPSSSFGLPPPWSPVFFLHSSFYLLHSSCNLPPPRTLGVECSSFPTSFRPLHPPLATAHPATSICPLALPSSAFVFVFASTMASLTLPVIRMGTEADISGVLITPKLQTSGWENEPHSTSKK